MGTQSPSPEVNEGGLNKYGVKRMVQVFTTIILYGVILFTAAGRLDWWLAWIYLGIYVVLTVFNAIMLWRRDTDLINERGRNAENQKDWDKALMTVYLALCVAVMLVAGLDAGRFGWQPVSSPWLWVGLAAGCLDRAVVRGAHGAGRPHTAKGTARLYRIHKTNPLPAGAGVVVMRG